MVQKEERKRGGGGGSVYHLIRHLFVFVLSVKGLHTKGKKNECHLTRQHNLSVFCIGITKIRVL